MLVAMTSVPICVRIDGPRASPYLACLDETMFAGRCKVTSLFPDGGVLATGAMLAALLGCNGCGESGKGPLERAVWVGRWCRYGWIKFLIYSAHARTRKSAGSMTRKLSVTWSQ